MNDRSEKIDYLDFAKGYAIFTIVLYHAFQRVDLSPIFTQAIVFGGSGVHLFFLLSGFGLSWSRTAASAGSFYRRRLTKIWLPYVLVLTISLVAALVFGLFPDRWGAWLAGVGLYQMFIEHYIQSFGGHFWFISTIVQFYLVFPFLKKIQSAIGNDRWFFALALGVSMAWWWTVFLLGKGEWRTWNSFFLQFLWEFALGMVLAGRMRDAEYGMRNFWWAWLPVGLFFTGIMVFMILKMGAAGRIFNDFPALLGYGALSLFVYECSNRLLPAVKRFFMWLNEFSFSLYLLHVLVLDFYLRLFSGPPAWWQVLLYLPLALLAAWAFEPVSRRWVAVFEVSKIRRG